MDLDKLIDVSDLTYRCGKVINPFTGEYIKIIFADDTASGRPCNIIDQIIIENIYPFYSNTHSNAICGTAMKNFINKTRALMRKYLKLTKQYKIIFSGNGCTGAVNHLVGKINFDRYDVVRIHTSHFEHHSNFLPWKEMMHTHRNMTINIIDTNKYFDILVNEYIKEIDNELRKISIENRAKRLDIFTLIACSNVTGKRYDLKYDKLWEYIKTKKHEGYNIYLLLDYACSAPYIKFDTSVCDGLFFSGHKFLGGQSTPGILVVDEKLLEIDHPYEPGGGCVEKADDTCTIYKPDIESREMGGTPNIIGIIRLGYILLLKQHIYDIIQNNEHILTKYINRRMRKLEEKYSSFKVIGLESKTDEDLPIYPVTIRGLHFNFITILLNDLFGIQTRGGTSCCGTFARICKKNLQLNGWCRISFNYLHVQSDVKKILEGLEYVITNGHTYLEKYNYDKDTRLYSIKK